MIDPHALEADPESGRPRDRQYSRRSLDRWLPLGALVVGGENLGCGALCLPVDVTAADGRRPGDALAAGAIALPVITPNAYGLLKTSSLVFLEVAPEGIDPGAIRRRVVALAGVAEVHDLHVWEVTSGFPALSAHVLVREDSDCHHFGRELKRVLHDEFENRPHHPAGRPRA